MTALLGFIGPLIARTPINIKHPERINQNRPAVFIFNHQSGLDPIILCRVIRRDIIGMAKVELRRNPILGPLLWFGETIFVDRKDAEKRQAAYGPAVDALSRGRSIAISPEGTRTHNNQLGEFRAGAFRIAKAANVPVVPIVIYNAGQRLGAKSIKLYPGTIDVEVLQPINPSHFVDPLAASRHTRSLYQQSLERYENQASQS